ncbi:hypothetical protein QQF64_008786 [Cirrhinus molitorella]|uniref:G-protein coupled receptors family 1 profile domain-containing protein n=1 Tax=Cirrhinus molitorella TaxID=172907 RepID=A0ABR3M759_9TELE
MENLSIIVSFELTLDPFSIHPGAKYPIFLFGIFIYVFGAFCNLTLLLLIILTQSLHKPMYFILLSLPLNDFVGITTMLPKVLSDIVTETNNTYYPLCVLQGFLLHMYGGGILFILAAMAFDRYVAIYSGVIMENLSIIVSFELTLDPFSIPPGAKYPIFLFGIFIYMFGAFCNLTLLLLIILTQSLHKPVYFILFSLPLNDFVGITSMLPKVLSDIVTETNNTYYPLCVLQAFLLHMYGGGVLFILAAMAFDRYIAIWKEL